MISILKQNLIKNFIQYQGIFDLFHFGLVRFDFLEKQKYLQFYIQRLWFKDHEFWLGCKVNMKKSVFLCCFEVPKNDSKTHKSKPDLALRLKHIYFWYT